MLDDHQFFLENGGLNEWEKQEKVRNHIDEIKLDKFVQRILVFEATEEDNEEENLIDLLA